MWWDKIDDFIANLIMSLSVKEFQQVVKEFWQKAASPSCHPSWRRMDSSDLDPFNTCHPTLHLDRFNRFCKTHERDKQTDKQTTLLRV